MQKLTKQDVVKMLALVKTAYPYAYREVDEKALDRLVAVWLECFEEYTAEEVKYAFKQAIKACKVPPTIADVIEQIEKAQTARDKSDGELWTEYLKLLHAAGDLSEKFRYTFVPFGGDKTQGEIAREELSRLWERADERIKEYCGSVGNLICTAKTDDLTYEKARFFKGIGNCRKRVETKKEVPQIFIAMTKNIKLIDEI